MNREPHEKGSKSTGLEMMNTPQIAQMSADYIRVEFEAVARHKGMKR
jgi:hypothetical protein